MHWILIYGNSVFCAPKSIARINLCSLKKNIIWVLRIMLRSHHRGILWTTWQSSVWICKFIILYFVQIISASFQFFKYFLDPLIIYIFNCSCLFKQIVKIFWDFEKLPTKSYPFWLELDQQSFQVLNFLMSLNSGHFFLFILSLQLFYFLCLTLSIFSNCWFVNIVYLYQSRFLTLKCLFKELFGWILYHLYPLSWEHSFETRVISRIGDIR